MERTDMSTQHRVMVIQAPSDGMPDIALRDEMVTALHRFVNFAAGIAECGGCEACRHSAAYDFAQRMVGLFGDRFNTSEELLTQREHIGEGEMLAKAEAMLGSRSMAIPFVMPTPAAGKLN